MSGIGKRFLEAGYKRPKSLINVEGKPVIAHVINMFPGEKNFVFICNKEHLKNTNMVDILNEYCPNGKIVPIDPHKKGPVYAVSKIYNLIEEKESVIINYCDFTCYWDYKHFKQWVNKSEADGCIPAYKGFHPHSLWNNNYAFIREEGGWVNAIKEKESFTKNKINEYASSGTYYFSKGLFVKKFFDKLMSKNININNEFYCSLVFNLMIKEKLSINIYELQHFMQWGTPQDLHEYENWSNTFRNLINPKNKINSQELPGTILIPMAGHGSRFKKEGYVNPKPFINVSSLPMFLQAALSLPKAKNYQFIIQEDYYYKIKNLANLVNKKIPNASFLSINNVPDGQAKTCHLFTKTLDENECLTISACDHGVIFDSNKFNELLLDSEIDIIIWAKRNHNEAIRNPQMYGWIENGNKFIKKVSVKKPFNSSKNNPIIIGTFTFKKCKFFNNAAESLFKRNGRVNNEFYVDSLINDAIKIGYKCAIFEVDHFICWGTPNELKTYQYWQSCFHKWDSHPYSLDKDNWVDNKQEEKNQVFKFIPADLHK